MQLIQINTAPVQHLIIPTNQPAPTAEQLHALLNTTDYTITTYTTNNIQTHIITLT
jgi:hypothetical protein